MKSLKSFFASYLNYFVAVSLGGLMVVLGFQNCAPMHFSDSESAEATSVAAENAAVQTEETKFISLKIDDQNFRLVKDDQQYRLKIQLSRGLVFTPGSDLQLNYVSGTCSANSSGAHLRADHFLFKKSSDSSLVPLSSYLENESPVENLWTPQPQMMGCNWKACAKAIDARENKTYESCVVLNTEAQPIVTTPAAFCAPGTNTQVGCPSIANGKSSKICNSEGSAYGACVSSCNSGYAPTGIQPTINCVVPTKPVDLVPDKIAFSTINNAEPNSIVFSNIITLSGLEPNYEVTLGVNNEYWFSIDAGTSALSGTFEKSKKVKTSADGQLVVRVKGTSNYYSSSMPMSLSINSISNFEWGYINWDVYSRALDYSGYTVGELGTVTMGVQGTEYTSNTITITGLEPNFTFSVGAKSSIGDAKIDAGTNSLSGTYTYAWIDVKTSAAGTIKVSIKARPPSSASSTNEVSIVLRYQDPYTVPSAVFKVSSGP